MTKFKAAYEEMMQKHREQFEKFKEVHDLYFKDQKTWEAKFNELGKPLLRIIEEAENRLCSKMEGSGRGNYSANLADKFREEIRKDLPLIDLVGVKIY